MWKMTGRNGRGPVLLGHDGKDYIGTYAGAFFTWATLWKDEIVATPTGWSLRWPFEDDAERFLAAQVFMREMGIDAVAEAPPKGSERYEPDEGLLY